MLLPLRKELCSQIWGTRWLNWVNVRFKRQNGRMNPTREERLKRFDSEIYGYVEGWLGDRMSQIINVIGSILDAQQVHGHIAEFGIHHGLFLFLLNTLRNEGEECFEFDVFDDHHLNMDGSGCGSLPIFLSHLDNLTGSERPFFRIIQRDTLSFSVIEISELFGKHGV